MSISRKEWQEMAPHLAHYYPDARPMLGATPMAPTKRSKYRNTPTIYNGRKYHSKAEATRAERLDYEKASGLIRDWTPQPRFTLGVPENVYIADFEVIGIDGKMWAEDVKGVRTARFSHNVRLWRAYGAMPLKVICRGKTVEVIEPAAKDQAL